MVVGPVWATSGIAKHTSKTASAARRTEALLGIDMIFSPGLFEVTSSFSLRQPLISRPAHFHSARGTL
jgi:hypothetical protein